MYPNKKTHRLAPVKHSKHWKFYKLKFIKVRGGKGLLEIQYKCPISLQACERVGLNTVCSCWQLWGNSDAVSQACSDSFTTHCCGAHASYVLPQLDLTLATRASIIMWYRGGCSHVHRLHWHKWSWPMCRHFFFPKLQMYENGARISAVRVSPSCTGDVIWSLSLHSDN